MLSIVRSSTELASEHRNVLSHGQNSLVTRAFSCPAERFKVRVRAQAHALVFVVDSNDKDRMGEVASVKVVAEGGRLGKGLEMVHV